MSDYDEELREKNKDKLQELQNLLDLTDEDTGWLFSYLTEDTLTLLITKIKNLNLKGINPIIHDKLQQLQDKVNKLRQEAQELRFRSKELFEESVKKEQEADKILKGDKMRKDKIIVTREYPVLSREEAMPYKKGNKND